MTELLLLSGLGPAFYNEELLDGTLFDPHYAARIEHEHSGGLMLDGLAFEHAGRLRPLLRSLPGRGGVPASASEHLLDRHAPHLTTWTLEAILTSAGLIYRTVDLSHVWRERPLPPTCGEVDIVLLSTTFIWHRASLAAALAWVSEYLPGARVVLGGQYSNLKYVTIMRDHPDVHCIVRGDGEHALPALVAALRADRDVACVPNLVYRSPSDGAISTTSVEYVNLDRHPSPALAGPQPIVPYESMRGCPFSCKFCSFPFASPTWRYKSALKIRNDWAGYVRDNGTLHVRAYDSTFPTPPRRLRELLDLLPAVAIGWEAFARANSIRSSETVERLVAAHCRMLTFGFESMSPRTLELMRKQVRAEDNRRAFELLHAGTLGYRASFMVGYPGETPDDFEMTHRFLVDAYEGHFLLNVFSLMDETMPVWEDAERLGLTVDNPTAPDDGWRHHGMDLVTARMLMRETLDEVRWGNDRAVHLLWQQRYERPLIPDRTPRENLWLEKLVERLAHVPRRARSASEARRLRQELLSQLAQLGVRIAPAPPTSPSAERRPPPPATAATP